MDTEILIMPGGAIKAISLDGTTAKVGGLLVRFTDANETDWYGDFFDAQTEFRLGDVARCPVYFNHGMNAIMGVTVMGDGVLTLTDAGVEIEAEIDVSDVNAKAIYDQVVAGEMGWSSGTAGHLVQRTQVKSYAIHGKSAWHIDYWPLGLDASLTGIPADSGNVASAKSKGISICSLKSRVDEQLGRTAADAEAKAALDAVRLEAIRWQASIL